MRKRFFKSQNVRDKMREKVAGSGDGGGADDGKREIELSIS